MTQLFNKPPFKDARRTLRNLPTGAETKLWYFLRVQGLGVKFRRQYGIGCYIVDFYSPELKLVIEVDGDVHLTKEAMKYDRARQEEIEKLGLRVIRFTNASVLCGMDGVILEIRRTIEQIRRLE